MRLLAQLVEHVENNTFRLLNSKHRTKEVPYMPRLATIFDIVSFTSRSI